MFDLIIELRDDLDKRHTYFQTTFDDESTLIHLKQKIEEIIDLKQEYQQLFIGKEDLGGVHNTLLTSLRLENGTTVVVKHLLLNQWSNYVHLWQKVNTLKETQKERTKLAQQAIGISEKLEECGFFVHYVDFMMIWADSIGKMMRYADETRDALESSASIFFGRMYPASTVTFTDKSKGTRPGVIVNVDHNGDVTRYFMKCYHEAGTESALQNTTWSPDLKEMYAYRLLQVLNSAPVVMFPFYSGSQYIYFIATEEVPGFRDLYNIEEVNLQRKVVIEAYLLSLLLALKDVNVDNFGVDDENDTRIIDFYVGDSYVNPKIAEEFKHKSNFGGIGRANEVLINCTVEERLRVGKNVMTRWGGIEEVTSDIIKDEKNELRLHGIKFETSIDDVEKYLQIIKTNYAILKSAFE